MAELQSTATALSDDATTVASQFSSVRSVTSVPDPTASLWRLRAQIAGRGSTGDSSATPRASVLSPEGANAPRQPLTMDLRAGQPVPPAHFNVLQKWEGFVLDVNGDTFVARLLDLTS